MTLIRSLLCAILCVAPLASVVGQTTGGNGNNNNNNNNNSAGIRIDGAGIVSIAFSKDPASQLKRDRQRALAAKSLPANLQTASETRFVSLVALERRCRQLRDAGQEWPDDVRYVAGLTRIDAIYLYPDEHDVVIAGPAEPFAPDSAQRQLGVESGRPVLRLDHGVTVLRATRRQNLVGCSIDPEPGRLANLQQYLQRNSSPASVAVVGRRYEEMAQVLGMQNVRVDGVPADSPVAQVLVEADYRMKRISLGLDPHHVPGLKSHLSMIRPGGNTMQRWWFIPCFTQLHRSDDRLAWSWAGPRAQLCGQEEVSNQAGQRSDAATTRLSTEAFAKQFSEKFPDLCTRSIVFAELQNVIDWTMVAAILNSEDGCQRVGWPATLFHDVGWSVYRPGPVPKQVMTTVNSRRAGSVILGLVSGGVTLDTRTLLRQRIAVDNEPAELEQVRATVNTSRAKVMATEPTADAAIVWWWD